MRYVLMGIILLTALVLAGCDRELPATVQFGEDTYYSSGEVLKDTSNLEYTGYDLYLYKIYSVQGLSAKPSDIYVRKAGTYYVYTSKVADKRYCDEDSECVRETSCCDCGMGTYINKKFQREAECSGPRCMCAEMESYGKCINHVCTAVTAKYCTSDAECACGKDQTGSCAIGNRKYIDEKEQCPDFCTGIANNLAVRCVNNSCIQMQKATCGKEGENLGAVVPGNTKECCEGLEPYIPPNIVGTRGTCQKPGYSPDACISDEDCVQKECCHATSCTNTANKGVCNVMCTMNCQSGTLDCGQGRCACINNRCQAQMGISS